MSELDEKLWVLLREIPRGKVTTYKLLAEKLGVYPRALGRMLNKNPHPVAVPCHRVVCSDGFVGGYKFGVESKIELLKEEGVDVHNGRVDLTRYLHAF